MQNSQYLNHRYLKTKTPQISGIFRQQRQTYNTNSIIHLYSNEPEEETGNFQIARSTSKNLSEKPVVNYKIPCSRLKRRKLLKSLQEQISTQHNKSKCGLSKKTSRSTSAMMDNNFTTETIKEYLKRPLNCRSKISQSTSAVVMNTASMMSSLDKIKRYSATTTDLFSGNYSKRSVWDKKKVQTNPSWISENTQTTGSLKTVSVMALLANKTTKETATQKTEKVVIKSMEDKATDMVEYLTQSDLYCIEWIHKNLLEIDLNPFQMVQDERIKELSEITCCTSDLFCDSDL